MSETNSFPQQRLPDSQKGDKWRRQHLDWADRNMSLSANNGVAATMRNKRINYDLVNGRIDMEDVALILNASGVENATIPDEIQHYPIMNGKLEVLRGEETQRRFEWRCVCTNQNAVSDIERKKSEELYASIQNLIRAGSQDEEDFRARLQAVDREFRYDWQDQREIRANALLNHFMNVNNTHNTFSEGFMDACTVAEEAYWCHIAGGKPVLERLNPRKLYSWRSGSSNRMEDADVLVYEDWWQPGRIQTYFYDQLSKKDMEYIDKLSNGSAAEDGDETKHFVSRNSILADQGIVNGDNFISGRAASANSDTDGNIRVIHMWWKSYRQIKRVKRYDQITGEEEYEFVSNDYQPDEYTGEEVKEYWVAEAWEGWKIGSDVYVGIKPCELQFNTMENPSECHFGVIGNYYNVNEDRVFSLVDILKPFAYNYDVIHQRLQEALEMDFGQAYELDLAGLPDEMDMDKFMYYLRKHHLAVKDSFKEGNEGRAKNVLAGNFASNSRGVVGSNNAQYIASQLQMLEFIMNEMSRACGITPQREGMVQNRETVGGVERATLQSSYITEWLFSQHADLKRRVLNCMLEVLKQSQRGKNITFPYTLSDGSMAVMTIPGDEFAENNYGIIVDNSPYTQKLTSQLETIAQAAMQTQSISLSSIMRIFTSKSVSETIRNIQAEEEENIRRQQMQAQREQEIAQAQLQQQMQLEQMRLEADERKNVRDNETRLEVARIQAEGRIAAEREYGEALIDEDIEKSKLRENARQFDAKLKADEAARREQDRLERVKLKEEREARDEENRLKQEELKVKRAQAAHKSTK